MYCGKCGAKVPEGYAYCMKCGTKLEKADQEENVVVKKRSNNKATIIIIIAVVIAACAVIVYYNLPKKNVINDFIVNFKWGTDLDVACDMVEKQYPNSEYLGQDGEDFVTYKITDYNGLKDVEGCISLYFDSNNSVCTIVETLTPKDNSDYDDGGVLFNEFLEQMNTKYGESSSNLEDYLYTWKTDDIEISIINVDDYMLLNSYKPIE